MSTSTVSTPVMTNALLRQVDLPTLLAHDGHEVNASGMTHCPFHAGGQERTPSMHVWFSNQRDRWVYFCHGCQDARGDALQYLRDRHQLDFDSAIAHLRRLTQAPVIQDHPQRSVTAREANDLPVRLSSDEQSAAATMFIDLMDVAAPHARARGTAYVVGRGIDPQLVAGEQFPHWVLDRQDLATMRERLAAHPGIDLMLRAGLIKDDERGRRPMWFDDVCIGLSRLRSGAPFYLWGRRLAHQSIPHLSHMKYMNQMERCGARTIPFGLDALAEARSRRVPIRIVEGQFTALGSRSLTDGQAAPTMALGHRIGFSGAHPHQLPIWTALVDEFRYIPCVEICPDNDRAGPKCAEGFVLADRLVGWLRMQGVRAVLRPLIDRPECEVITPAHIGPAFGYPQKDFCDVACKQRGVSS